MRSLFPLSVGGWTIAIASFNTWFRTDVETLRAFWLATLFIISNNLFTLCPVLADINKRNVNKIFCIGDSIIKCTHPDLVIDKLREVCEVILIGNSDYAICRPEVKDRKFWTREIIGEERANFIYNLPISHDFYMSGHLIRLFHASPYHLDDIFNPMFTNKGTNFSGKEIENPEDLFKNTEFIGKTENAILTMDEDTIPIDEIVSIKIKKSNK